MQDGQVHPIDGFVLAYSIISNESRREVERICNLLRERSFDESPPMVLVATNCDMQENRSPGTSFRLLFACYSVTENDFGCQMPEA